MSVRAKTARQVAASRRNLAKARAARKRHRGSKKAAYNRNYTKGQRRVIRKVTVASAVGGTAFGGPIGAVGVGLAGHYIAKGHYSNKNYARRALQNAKGRV